MLTEHVPGMWYSGPMAELSGLRAIPELFAARSADPVLRSAIDVRSPEALSAPHLAAYRTELDRPPAVLECDMRELEMRQRKCLDGPVKPGTEPLVLPGEGLLGVWSRDPQVLAIAAAVSVAFGTQCPISGDFFYPSGGLREWHSNKWDTAGWRMYAIHTPAPGGSFFRAWDPSRSELPTSWDVPGLANFFRIDPGAPLYHCVGALTTWRWSLGFVIPGDWAARLGV